MIIDPDDILHPIEVFALIAPMTDAEMDDLIAAVGPLDCPDDPAFCVRVTDYFRKREARKQGGGLG